MSDSTACDVLFESFRSPPVGYGEVAFYWWLGDPLTRERLTWQLDRLADASVSGLQINYAHSDEGGLSWGLTYPSDPPLFSTAWWELFDWFIKEARQRGMAVSLSDYTLGGPGQGWFVDEVIAANPTMRGSKLLCVQWDLQPGERVPTSLTGEALCVRAYELAGDVIMPGTGQSIEPLLGARGKVDWSPDSARARVVAVLRQHVPASLDPMTPGLGQKVCEAFFEKFTSRYPDAAGRELNFFFSDELNFGISGHLWNDTFAAEFKARKGYDLVPELPALFVDTGPRTPKVRLDYFDVLVSLSEENYFRPVYAWHEERGMTYGCDHGGRGRDVVEFGDYFRTQRWNQGPGCDQPRLQADVVKNKVASSISHMYQRPRTWLEGFYSSGWGTTSSAVADATWRNFAMGHNLLTLHGLYYSTHGGWWEWAPPCNHFRMPYWQHLKLFLRSVERLSFLLSQGTHVCDVALVYPVELVQATADSSRAETAFACAHKLYGRSIDLDFIDAESLERATIERGVLKVAGEQFQILVLPALEVMRYRSLEQAVRFAQSGGRVFVVGQWPSATERAGRDDPNVTQCVHALRQSAVFVEDADALVGAVRRTRITDFHCHDDSVRPFHLHRRVGDQDIYFVYGVPRETPCFFRARGHVQVWDARTGERRTQYQQTEQDNGTVLRFPNDPHEPCVLVFSPGSSAKVIDSKNLREIQSVNVAAHSLLAFATGEGPCTALVADDDRQLWFHGSSEVAPQPVILSNRWTFELIPTLDNTWGDFRLPATPECISAEVRQLRCAPAGVMGEDAMRPDFDDSAWTMQTVSFGPRLWVTGPLSTEQADALEQDFVQLQRPDQSQPFWRPFDLSMRFGVEGDPGRQGYHGLKGRVTDEFLTVGRRNMHDAHSPTTTYDVDPTRPCHFYWTAFHLHHPADIRLVHDGLMPARVCLNGGVVRVNEVISLPAGTHRLLIRYDTAGRNYVVVIRVDDSAARFEQTYPLSMSWYNNPHVIPFDATPWDNTPVGWYRCTLPPGFVSLRADIHGDADFWVNGRLLTAQVDQLPSRDGELPSRADEFSFRNDELLSYNDGLPSRNSDAPSHTVGGAGQLLRHVVRTDTPMNAPSVLAIRVRAARGHYGGAVFAEPITLTCGVGVIDLGDWSDIDGLACYSGGASYRTTTDLAPLGPDVRVRLEIHDVAASAEVIVNGVSVGSRVAPPWVFDVTPAVKAGTNSIEVRVFNTLANHYRTVPTRFGGSCRSGLFGPVRLGLDRLVTLHARNDAV